MAKITELPAATGTVTMEDIVPIVDDPDGATPTTKKVTVRELMEAANGIVATLTGSKFSGPVTASLGLSASYIALGTSASPTTGHVRLPINGTIYGLSAGAGDARLLRFNSSGAGYDLHIGEGSLVGSIVLETTAAPGGGVSIQGAGGERVSFGTTAIFAVPLTASHGVSASFGSFGSGSGATLGTIRLPNGATINFRNALNTENVEAVRFSGGNNLVFGNTSNANAVFVQSPDAKPLYFQSDLVTYRNTAGTADRAVFSTGDVRLMHSGSTTREYDSRLKVWEFPIVGQTTDATPTTLFTFPSGSNGKCYAVDYRIQAQSTTTTGSIVQKGEAALVRSGGTMTVKADTASVVWRSTSTISGSLAGSTGDFTISGTGLGSETLNWRGFVSVQEVG